MAAPSGISNSQSSSLVRPEARQPVFGVNLISSHRLAPRPLAPVKIGVIGNHLPRQCKIATFTTDLCNAIAAEYGAAQLSVVAINDGQSSYTYPERVRFEIMNRFRKLGFIDYNGRIQVHKSLLKAVLLDRLPEHGSQAPHLARKSQISQDRSIARLRA